MATLSYWYAENLSDNDCYSIIAKTKKAAVAAVAENSHAEFAPVERRVIHYKDAFDLFEQATAEGGGRGAGNPA